MNDSWMDEMSIRHEVEYRRGKLSEFLKDESITYLENLDFGQLLDFGFSVENGKWKYTIGEAYLMGMYEVFDSMIRETDPNGFEDTVVAWQIIDFVIRKYVMVTNDYRPLTEIELEYHAVSML